MSYRLFESDRSDGPFVLRYPSYYIMQTLFFCLASRLSFTRRTQ